ncbi:hypothetical protein BU23DRAFT_261679 [Bimuria novae-zelandiae CBS 107.79]|uniref:Zn(2)-C6 fungal-type domain-containing protein n=1 Tax=Bimuria novae-zelandiae CBS 107.79 TaxID=1447943 RepID=A0A6A5UV32_9PLEO|nr:hypothetical protein BU23DRAFT_261679 [Bimuria novae-zelandiae CBS 107.79]
MSALSDRQTEGVSDNIQLLSMLASCKCRPGQLPFPHEPCERCRQRGLVCSERQLARRRMQPSSNSFVHLAGHADSSNLAYAQSCSGAHEVQLHYTKPFQATSTGAPQEV